MTMTDSTGSTGSTCVVDAVLTAGEVPDWKNGETGASQPADVAVQRCMLYNLVTLYAGRLHEAGGASLICGRPGH